MYPYIHIIIPSYGLLAFLGFFLCLMLLYLRKDKFEIGFGQFLKMFISGMAGLLIGSKLLYAVTRIPWLIQNFSFMNLLMLIPQSGFVFYGGLIGAICGVRWYVNRSKCCGMITAFNFITPAFPLFHCFGRIGCFMAGCCYGKEMPPVNMFGVITLDRIPTQLIEAAFELILFVICLIAEKKNKNTSLLKLYLVTYGIFRFCIEFFRGDAVRGFLFGLSTSQWVSMIIELAIIISFIRNKRSLKTVST